MSIKNIVDANETDIIILNEIARGLYYYGAKLGENAKYSVDQGLVSEENVRVMVTGLDIAKIIPKLPPQAHFYMKLGTSSAGVASNAVVTGCGVYTGGKSAIGYATTNSKAAKGCYALSVVCSGVAVTSCGAATLAKTCALSEQGLLAEVCGYAFMKLGEIAHVAALTAEGKSIPSHLKDVQKSMRNMRKPIRGSAYASDYMGFVLPGSEFGFSEIIEKIPFQKIGKVVGLSLTVYGYYRIVLVGYRYSQQLITKYRENRRKIKFKNEVFVQAKFVAVSLYSRPFVQKKLLINRFIINNAQVIY